MYDYLRLLFAGVLVAGILVAGILLGRTTIYSLGISSFPKKIPHFFPTLGKIVGILGKIA